MMLLCRNLGVSTEHAICWYTCVLRTMGKLTTRAVRDSVAQTRVRTVRWKHGVAEETKDGEAHLEFKVGVTGWEEGERSSRRTALLDLTDIGLRSALRCKGDLIFIPGDMWPEFTPKFGMNGWWYTAKEEVLR